MKAICPNNKNHKEFITTAYVVEEWLVNEKGEFIEVTDESVQVVHGKETGRTWTCSVCGANAIMKEQNKEE